MAKTAALTTCLDPPPPTRCQGCVSLNKSTCRTWRHCKHMIYMTTITMWLTVAQFQAIEYWSNVWIIGVAEIPPWPLLHTDDTFIIQCSLAEIWPHGWYASVFVLMLATTAHLPIGILLHYKRLENEIATKTELCTEKLRRRPDDHVPQKESYALKMVCRHRCDAGNRHMCVHQGRLHRLQFYLLSCKNSRVVLTTKAA